MNTEQLKAFLQVAREGRLTVAARQLGVSQPGLSRQLKSLETELGVRLLVRAPGGVVLTDAGERFLPHARRALDAMTVGTAELGELTTTPRGPVSLGTLRTVGTYLLPELVEAFKRRYPEVLPRLSDGSHDMLEARMASGELDLCIVSLPLKRLDLVAQKLWEEGMVLAVPRGHRLTKLKRPVALTEAVEEPWVVIPGMAGTHALEAACEERGVKPRIAVEMDSAEGLRRMVERGLGVALLPALMTRDHASRNFDVVELTKGGPRRQVVLVHRGEEYLTAAARALKTFIVDALRRSGPS
ncbi:LysR family transcriptional regulator [Vitiosangium sp. GDMCC 1.1324]|uniref:LysR family transcriptional regulator n=1 Tax=Vitiosangium sp. (strain GDMCC 1.1324) TaxID=2138576 RepID=UPI000D3C9A17|nr:LysR family transcriptional regulator [Vitiosangium sp. GDMCC 1.1324]PTL77089.1 LysR family transcriptional regulator [Vitiosangium sp. GDMCC 1.1324]